MQGKEPQLRVVQNTSGREGGSCLNPEDCKRPFQVACCCQRCLHVDWHAATPIQIAQPPAV